METRWNKQAIGLQEEEEEIFVTIYRLDDNVFPLAF
jgi:hypothetical protein